MIRELQYLENVLLKKSQLKITNLVEDLECGDYLGYNFNIKDFIIKFRKAKITPKKVGLFVSLWKRNHQGETSPFHEQDSFDLYLIFVEEDLNVGCFVFTKDALIANGILSTSEKEGKRGFRLYPSWCITENKQAKKTQIWQLHYFIDLNGGISEAVKKFEKLTSSN